MAYHPPKSSLYNFEQVGSESGIEVYRMNVCPALLKIWTLQGIDTNEMLLQSVCYLLKEETDVACDNAVDFGMVITTLYNIAETLSLDVISYDYPSYGLSTGKLSEKHLYRSIQLVYNFMSNKLGIDGQKIIIWEKSLGTVPSIQFSPTKRPVRFSKIRKVHHQTLIVHGSKDEICALKHILKLSERCPGFRSVKVVVNGKYNNLEKFCAFWLYVHYFLSQQGSLLEVYLQ
ncbi:Alpha/beta hydrolase domain-containing protein 17C [Trichinella papuae]|uniref:Alpha/beta hydrolase domain-containing protein 17C n=1 Tax=Trichinella papuae TaxID=268474 RepID=A0A0V1N574_9BILA|nr:Alpha/beta hydrolase domain-containing protein 17C [Trichinella papuae]